MFRLQFEPISSSAYRMLTLTQPIVFFIKIKIKLSFTLRESYNNCLTYVIVAVLLTLSVSLFFSEDCLLELMVSVLLS